VSSSSHDPVPKNNRIRGEVNVKATGSVPEATGPVCLPSGGVSTGGGGTAGDPTDASLPTIALLALAALLALGARFART
jgi:hypothetical protein